MDWHHGSERGKKIRFCIHTCAKITPDLIKSNITFIPADIKPTQQQLVLMEKKHEKSERWEKWLV